MYRVILQRRESTPELHCWLLHCTTPVRLHRENKSPVTAPRREALRRRVPFFLATSSPGSRVVTESHIPKTLTHLRRAFSDRNGAFRGTSYYTRLEGFEVARQSSPPSRRRTADIASSTPHYRLVGGAWNARMCANGILMGVIGCGTVNLAVGVRRHEHQPSPDYRCSLINVEARSRSRSRASSAASLSSISMAGKPSSSCVLDHSSARACMSAVLFRSERM